MAFSVPIWIPLAGVFFSAVTVEEDAPVLALCLFFILCLLFNIPLIGSSGTGWPEEDNLRKKEIPAKDTIISISETGTRLDDQPLLKTELAEQPLYESRFVTSVEQVVPYSFLPQVQQDKILPDVFS